MTEVVDITLAEQKIEQMDAIAEGIHDCKKCPLFEERTNAIAGSGTFQSGVLLVRDFPEYTEDKTGNPWSSSTARLFDRLLNAAHISVHRIYMTYLVHCRPREDDVSADSVQKCSVHLLEIMKTLKPKIVVVCGRQVLHFFLGRNKKVTNTRGQFAEVEFEGVGKVLVYSINHPKTMTRFPLTKKKEMFDDLNCLFSKIKELGIKC